MKDTLRKEIVHEFEHGGEVMAIVLHMDSDLKKPQGATLRNVDQLVKGHTVNMGLPLPTELIDGVEDFDSDEFKTASMEYVKSLDFFENFVKSSGDNCRELYQELVESGEITE